MVDDANNDVEQRKRHAVRKPKQTRRPKGSGSTFIVERKTASGNTYKYFRSVRTITIDGKRIRLSADAKTPDASIDALRDKIAQKEVEMGVRSLTEKEIIHKFAKLTIETCMADWLREKSEQNLAPESMRQYDSRIRQHILPAMGERYVRSITNDDMKTFFNETLVQKDLGYDSRRQVFIIMKSAFEVYVRDSKLLANPMTGLKTPPKKQRTMEDRAKIRQASYYIHAYLLDHARANNNEARWMLGLLGLRQAEVLGLTDDCFVIKGRNKETKHRMLIQQQLQRVPAKHGCQREGSNKPTCGEQSNNCPMTAQQTSWVVKKTKTPNGIREIVLPDVVWNSVQEHLKRQQAFRKTDDFTPYVTNVDPEQDRLLRTLVFTRSNGYPQAAQTDRREFNAMRDKINGLSDDITVHTLRHIATTTMLRDGADRNVMIAHMGWSPKNADAQMDTYTHNDKARDAAPTVAGYVAKHFDKKKASSKKSIDELIAEEIDAEENAS